MEGKPGIEHIKSLDGLRGIAIILVLFYHFTKIDGDFGIAYWMHKISRLGYIGVDLFFVLSGFLISRILFNMNLNRKSIISFFARRVIRIFPVYFLMLFVLFIIVKTSFITQNYWASFQYQEYFWFYLSNLLVGIKGFDSAPWLTHTWSLAVEEQFYLFFPFLLPFFKRPRHFVIGILFVIALRVLLWNLGMKSLNYTLVFTRMDCFIIGSFLAYALNHHFPISKLIHYITIGLFLFTILVTEGLKPSGFIMQTIGYTITALFFFSIIHLAILYNESNRLFFLSKGVLPFFGKYSYCQYLIHIPILKITEFYISPGSSYLAQISTYLICTISTIIISVLSWHLIEKQFLKFKTRFPY